MHRIIVFNYLNSICNSLINDASTNATHGVHHGCGGYVRQRKNPPKRVWVDRLAAMVVAVSATVLSRLANQVDAAADQNGGDDAKKNVVAHFFLCFLTTYRVTPPSPSPRTATTVKTM
jgi:hypothetical protein